MARLYTGSHDIISLRNSYHGNAGGTMGATAQKNWKFNIIQVRQHSHVFMSIWLCTTESAEVEADNSLTDLV
jgi:4-aminobutyrate aminotransferase-like enzyme